MHLEITQPGAAMHYCPSHPSLLETTETRDEHVIDMIVGIYGDTFTCRPYTFCTYTLYVPLFQRVFKVPAGETLKYYRTCEGQRIRKRMRIVIRTCETLTDSFITLELRIYRV